MSYPDFRSKEFRKGRFELDIGIARAVGIVAAINPVGLVLAIGPFFLFLIWGK